MCALVDRLEKTQQLLYMSLEDVLSMTSDCKREERHSMIEKDKLLRELDLVRELLRPEEFVQPPDASGRVAKLRSLNNVSADNTLSRQNDQLQVRSYTNDVYNIKYCSNTFTFNADCTMYS